MGKQILPIILAFVLGFGLGYVFHSQPGTESPTDREVSATQADTDPTEFEEVGKVAARGHVRKYKKKNPDDGRSKYYPVYAVWSALDHVDKHFEGKIKRERDLSAITPDWATGIRVYHALDDRGKAVNYLVFTDSTQTANQVPNDRLDSVYVVSKKIDMTREKEPRSGKGKVEFFNSHIVCNPRCPDESLF